MVKSSERREIDSVENQFRALAIKMGGGLGSVCLFEAVRTVARPSLLNYPLFSQPDSIGYHFLQNSGDLMNGYLISLGMGCALDLVAPKLSEGLRDGLSVLVGCTAVVLAETVLPQGTPEVWDIPAGLLGAGLYFGLSWLASKRYPVK